MIVVPFEGRKLPSAGDVVVLRSGGPPMTVAEVGEATVICAWFLASGMIRMAEFPNAAVMEYTKEGN